MPTKEIISPVRTPVLFDWQHNDFEAGLRSVYRAEPTNPGRLSKVVDEMRDSQTFWDLLVAYLAAEEDSKEPLINKETGLMPIALLRNEAFMALLARVFAAGTMTDLELLIER